MAKWLEQASQESVTWNIVPWSEVMGSNPGRVEFGVHNTSVFEVIRTKNTIKSSNLNPKVHSPPFAIIVIAAALSTALPGRLGLSKVGFKNKRDTVPLHGSSRRAVVLQSLFKIQAKTQVIVILALFMYYKQSNYEKVLFGANCMTWDRYTVVLYGIV